MVDEQLPSMGAPESSGAPPSQPSSSPTPASFAPPSGGQAPSGQADFRSTLSGRGIDYASQFPSDEAAVAYYSRLTPQAVQQLERHAEMAQRMYPYLRQLQAQQAAAQTAPPSAAPVQAAPAAEPEPYWPAAPEWKAEWESRLGRDANGQIVLRDPMSNPALIEKHEAFQKWRQERAESLLSDPRKAMKLDDYFNERFKQVMEEHGLVTQAQLAEAQQTHRATGYVTENAPWLFKMDAATGQPEVDPITGRYVASESGADFHGILSELVNSNADQQRMADIALLATHAMQVIRSQGNGNGRAPAAPSPQAAPPQPQYEVPFSQQPFMGAGYSPSRAGSMYASPVSALQNPNDVESGLRQNMRAAGLVS